MRLPSFFIAVALLPNLAHAQRVVIGNVTSNGKAIVGANVFVAATLEGAFTDSTGRFRLITRETDSLTLMVQRVGYYPLARAVTKSDSAFVAIEMSAVPALLAPITAFSSRFAAGEERGATLTAIDVVSTAGTTADVARAIQTLPGAQAIDEGTGLFVRGGDFTETTVLVNDAVLQTPFSYQSPNGTFIGTVDPFLLDGIVFAAGGFGARYGNALSGIAALHTSGAPARSSITVGAGLAALSTSVDVVAPGRLGVRLAANQNDTHLMFRVNGSTQHYDPPPIGYDRSGSLSWNYGNAGEVKLFAVAQQSRLGTAVHDASNNDVFALSTSSSLAVLTWRDSIGTLRPFAHVSHSSVGSDEDYGVFRHALKNRYLEGAAGTEFTASRAVTLRTGTEWELLTARSEGSIPDASYDQQPGAAVVVFRASPSRVRTAGFGEADFVVHHRTRITAGLRTDHSDLSASTTLDPRLAVAFTVAPQVVLTSSIGIYHQLPDPLFLDTLLGNPTLPPMRAAHSIVGLQLGSEGTLLRIEAYEKRYAELAQMTRDFDVVGHGVGRVRGVDAFAAGSFSSRSRWRISATMLNATRTDPHTQALSRAPFDVPYTITSVLQQALPRGWNLGVTHRRAAGRPFTPVTSASYDAGRNVWTPTYGSLMSERLPSFDRVDVGLTQLRSIRNANAVIYFAVNNLFDRDNLLTYRYSADYAERLPIRSLFNRSFYFGASLTWSSHK